MGHNYHMKKIKLYTTILFYFTTNKLELGSFTITRITTCVKDQLKEPNNEYLKIKKILLLSCSMGTLKKIRVHHTLN